MRKLLFALLIILFTASYGHPEGCYYARPAVSGCTGDVADSYTGGTGYCNLASGSYNIYQSFSFTATSDYSLCTIVAQPYKVGSPTGTISAYVYSDNGSGSPNTSLGGCSNTVDSSAIPDGQGGALQSWTLTTPVDIVSGTRYHYIFYKAAADGSNCVRLQAQPTAGVGYNNRSGDGSTWTVDDNSFAGHFEAKK
jgi:hypothetical protein